jgi:hypothetical protein
VTEPPSAGWSPEPPSWQPPPPPPPSGPYGPDAQSGPWENLGSGPATPYRPQRRIRARLLAAAAVVIALGAGGVATVVALSDTASHGASSPTAAIQKIVDDINASDLAGVLDDLSPAERTSVADPMLKAIDELKRIHVLQPGADPKKVAAVTASIQHLSFGPTIAVNDHVQVVQITGGTVSLAADVSKIPFTKDLVNALFPNGQPGGSAASTVDIGQAVHDRGKPLRFAAQKVSGRWYPSLFYTIADNAVIDANLGQPTTADRIAAVGASSPADAVRQLTTALLNGDVSRAIQLAAPDELAALHDYGGLLIKDVGSHYAAVPVHLDDLQLTPTTSSGNAQRLVVKSIALTTTDGKKIKVDVSGSCVSVTIDQDEQRFCAAQASAQINSLVQNLTGKPVTAAQRTAFDHLFGSTTQAGGIVTTESDGKWYVAPVRTLLEAGTSVLSRVQGDDVIELIRLFANIGH